MSGQRRVLDPELAALVTLFPPIDITDAPRARETERTVSAGMRSGRGSTVTCDGVEIVRPDGSSLALSVHRPARAPSSRPLPVLLFLHGGFFVLGGLHTEADRCAFYAEAVGCAVVSVDYRLAPEHPYPAAVDDCLLALHWLSTHAEQEALDPSRMAIGGLSAGGALAAATALWCRDRALTAGRLPGGDALPAGFVRPPRPVLQLLLHPVLDASCSTHSAKAFTDTPVLTADQLATMWRLYLGVDFADAPVPVLASPAHEPALGDLPPVYLAISEFDPLRDECLRYAQRLLDAGVAVELHHYARAFHCFDSFSATRMGRNALTAQVEALATAFR